MLGSQPIFVIATVVIATSILTLLVATIVLLVFRWWKKVIASRCISQLSDKLQEKDANPECKQSDWARKDSNVLWSMYLEDDDLKSQFAMPRKPRLFSIGSVSTLDEGRCPLDRRPSCSSTLRQQASSVKSVGGPDQAPTDIRI